MLDFQLAGLRLGEVGVRGRVRFAVWSLERMQFAC